MTLDPFSAYEKKILRLEEDNRALVLSVELMVSLVEEADHLAGCGDECDQDVADGEYDDNASTRVDRCQERLSMLAEVIGYTIRLMVAQKLALNGRDEESLGGEAWNDSDSD